MNPDPRPVWDVLFDTAAEHFILLAGVLTGAYGLWKAIKAWQADRYEARRARERVFDDLEILKAEIGINGGTERTVGDAVAFISKQS